MSMNRHILCVSILILITTFILLQVDYRQCLNEIGTPVYGVNYLMCFDWKRLIDWSEKLPQCLNRDGEISHLVCLAIMELIIRGACHHRYLPFRSL